MSKDEPKQEVYYIPPNYQDAGGIMGGRFTERNGIEMAVFGVPVAWINFKFVFPNFSLETSIIIAMCTIIPILALCAFGINGESITQILMAYLRFNRKRRKLSYMGFDVEPTDDTASKFSFDKFLDSVSSDGFSGTFKKMREAKEKEYATDQNEGEPVEKKASPEKVTNHTKAKKGSGKGEKAPHSPASKSQPKKNGNGNRMVNSALKEALIRKLELGDDEYDD